MFFRRTLLFLPLLLASIFPVFAEDVATTDVLVFVRAGCPHCEAEEEYLETIKEEQNLNIILVETTERSGREMFEDFVERSNIDVPATPITLVGSEYFIGFGTPETHGPMLMELIERNRGSSFAKETKPDLDIDFEDANVDQIAVPFFGSIDPKAYALPVLTIILGFIDGFNPCAMWVLVTFLIVLVNLGDRRKMIYVASLFILAEAIMYFLILNLWGQFWQVLPRNIDSILVPLVGLLAIGGGVFFLYEGIKGDGTCKVTNSEQKKRITQRIREIANSPVTWVTTFSIIFLALSVNIIEFVCSIGIPQAFTKILELNGLNFIQTQGLLGLYTLFYMIDDFIVFGIALASFSLMQHSSKFIKISNFGGGILMIILGIILIVDKSILIF